MRTIDEQNIILDAYIPGWMGYLFFSKADHAVTRLVCYPEGGFDNRPYVVSDETRWNVDFPESPPSILFLLYNVCTLSREELDLRNVEVSFALRSYGINLFDANIYFWIFHEKLGSTRWHYTANPLSVSEGEWTHQSIKLLNDESQWNCSFSKLSVPVPLDTVLSRVSGYGFAFTDFQQPVTGRIEMSAFSFNKNIDSIVPP